jgi:hypothetical protein
MSLLLFGCAYTPPNFGPVIAHQEGSRGPRINLPTAEFSERGVVSEPFLGAHEYARINSVFSYDFHLRNRYFHFSPSIYYLGFGSAVGFILDNRTVVSFNSGISFLPIAYSSGISVSQSFYEKVFLGYGYNWASVNKVNCAGVCVLENEKVIIGYHRLGLSYLHSGTYFVEAQANVTNESKVKLGLGIAVGAFLKMKGKASPATE